MDKDTVDYLTIKGGYIHELLEAFRLEYEHLQQAKPLDVVLVAGYADLPSNSLHPRIPCRYNFVQRFFMDKILQLKSPFVFSLRI